MEAFVVTYRFAAMLNLVVWRVKARAITLRWSARSSAIVGASRDLLG